MFNKYMEFQSIFLLKLIPRKNIHNNAISELIKDKYHVENDYPEMIFGDSTLHNTNSNHIYIKYH